MPTPTSTSASGCGQGTCACSGQTENLQPPVACVNGIALHTPGEVLAPAVLQELAWTEILRQHAVREGVLPAQHVLQAPVLDDAQMQAIEALLEREVPTPEPTEPECQRYFEANKAQFVRGQALHLRHILFAVTPGVDVHALRLRAENALLELSRKDVVAQRFEQLAAELSNCPSSAQGGDLGWVTPEDCAPELANELFNQTDIRCGMGVHPRLVHTRFGFHLIEVLSRRKGRTPPFEEVAETVRAQLRLQARATALRQHMKRLVGRALVEGVVLEGVDSPLVQ